MADKNFPICLMKFDDRVWLLLTDDHSIQSWESVGQALGYFERAYKANHGRGYEASMSAVINFISFQPTIVVVESLEWLAEHILSEERSVHAISNASGRYEVAATRPEALALWESGDSPSLI